MNSLKSLGLAIAATIFIHFRNPQTNALAFELDANGEPDVTKPVGVTVYTPGSKAYRNAEDAVNTQSVKDGKKGLTGEKMRENATKIMARTITEFRGFDYDGKKPNGLDPAEREAINTLFLNDLEYVNLRDQIAAEQADLGNASVKPTGV